MPPTRPSSPAARVRRAARAAVLTSTALGAAAAAAPAGAAWTPPARLEFSPAAVVIGGPPGQAAFAGTDGDEVERTAVHVPGSAALRPVASPVPAGADHDYGDGGAVAFVAPGSAGGSELRLGTLDGAGAYTPAGGVPVDPDSLFLEGVAAAGDGSVAAVAVDLDSQVHVLFARPGLPATDVVVSAAGAFASTADIAPLAGGGYAAAWDESDDVALTTVAAARIGADGAPGLRTPLAAGAAVPAGTAVSTLDVPAGAAVPTVVWSGTVSDAVDVVRSFVALSAEGAASREVVGAPGDAVDGAEARAFASGRILVSATTADDAGADVVTTKVLVPATGEECTAPAGVPAGASARVGDAIALVGTTADGDVSRQDVREDCTATAPVAGPSLGGATVARAAVDAEGSLVVAAGDEGSAGSFTVDDRTPPVLEDLRVPSRVAAGSRLTASVQASDAWGVGTPAWRLDGEPFDTGTTAGGRAPEPGEHRLEVTVTDAAGNRTRATADVTTVADGPGSAPAPPGADVPLPRPSKPRKTPRRPSDPTVRIRSVQKTTRGWVLRLRVTGASRVRLRLYRERYLGAGELRRRPTCPVRPRPLRRPPSGLRGRTTVVVRGSSVALRIPRPLADALRKRGRYTLSVVALGTGTKARTASPAANRSFTAC